MLNNIVEKISSFISALKTAYGQQGRIGKILLPSLFLLATCCLCSILVSLFPLGSRNSLDITPSPNISPSAGIEATPTALFNFDSVTFTPFPTFPAPTAFPTLIPPPTETPTPTQTVPTATITVPPSATALPATTSSIGSIRIVTVNKPEEYVDIQNIGNAPVDLRGWRLVSKTGNQSCTLRGVLQPSEVLRVWAGTGSPGFSCGYSRNIWNDSQSDPAVLYNAQGEEVSRFP